jgi:GT2 family glycosyltransferase
MILQSHDFHLSEPLVFSIGQDALLVAWDEADVATGQLELRMDGATFAGRRASLRLGKAGSRTRMVFAFQAPAQASSVIHLLRDGAAIAQIPLRHQALETPASLVEGLDDIGRSRLLSFVVGICRGALRLSTDDGFREFCRALVRTSLSSDAISFAPRARLIGDNALYSAPAPTTAIGAIETVYLMDDKSITENRFRAAVAVVENEARLLLIAPLGLSRRSLTAVLVGESGAVLATIPSVGNVPAVMELAADATLSSAERRYVLRCLGQLADDPEVAAMARALQIFAPERARELADVAKPVAAALEFTASCGQAGVFLRGWIRDPHRLVQDAELISPFGEARLSSCWQRLPRPDLAKTWKDSNARDGRPGFVALAPVVEPLSVMQHGLCLLTAGGRIQVTPPARAPSDAEARDMILRSVSEADLTDDLLTNIIMPAAGAIHSRVMAAQSSPEIIDIGIAKPNPVISFVIPLYRNLSFLRLQVGAFAIDPQIRRDAEIVYVLDSPEQRRELEHLLRGLNILTGLAFRLVVMAENFGYAAANNTGVRTARGRLLMLLNSDVIPLAPGWLATLCAALEMRDGKRETAIVGPKLLFDDGSLQHAGLTFEKDPEGRWYNTHLFKGYPRDWPAANLPCVVPGVTGAAMLLPRATYESVGGFTENYIVGDYEDSDLCLKIRAEDREIRYEPRAALHHFERRSIELHPGYSGTVASAYNRRLHAERWSDAMAAVVAEFARGLESDRASGARAAVAGSRQ